MSDVAQLSVDLIQARWAHVRQQVEFALRQTSDPARDVKIIVVTKGQPIEVVRAAAAAGVRVFGENYPEESEPKILALAANPGLSWHMIGHLQSRKARIVVEHFHMLESLDRLSLAEKLERRLAEAQRVLPVLLEVNVGGEESKSGWRVDRPKDWESLLPDIEGILEMPHIHVEGLMTMPPLMDDPESARPFFAQVSRLREWLAGRYPQACWGELSMGTSMDYTVAVEEGATMVRIGTAILGPRPA